MKKRYILLILTVVLATALILILYMQGNNNVSNFSLNDFSYEIENFSSDLCVNEIITPKEAKEAAEDIWTEIYGNSVKWEKPYVVSFDEVNRVWLVEGTLPFWSNVGGVPGLLIKENGEVLAVWHGK